MSMDSNKEIVTAEELLISNMYDIQALINVLERKGIVTKIEILDEVKDLVKERNKKMN